MQFKEFNNIKNRGLTDHPSRKRKSAEIEFLNNILVKVSGHKIKSSQTRVFVWSTFVFSVLQNAIHELTRVFLFRGFLCGFQNQSRENCSVKSLSRRDCK